jgi:predicted alpha/beta superfamily hydrolase
VLNDTVLFNVWLPYGYKKGHEEYPVIFLHSYGALTEYGMNIAAELNKKRDKFPKSVVIELTGSTSTKSISEITDFSYFRKGLNDKGQNYLNALKTEVFPFIKAKYSTSDFRAYMGHSYFATYANLVFAAYPDTFDAYILFAPESLNDFQDTFQLDTIKNKYQHKFYFVSTGSKDVKRRLNFNHIISRKIGSLTNIYFKSRINDSADHNSIVDQEVTKSLEFLFHNYFSPSHLDSTDLTGSFQKEIRTVRSIYKMTNLNLERYHYSLYDLGAQRKDKKFIEYLVATEKRISNDPLHLFNIGYTYKDTFKDKVNAEKYYRKSIEVCISNQTPKSAFNGYSWLAKLYSEQGDYKKSFKLLEEGFLVSGNYMLLYQAAGLAEHDDSLIIPSQKYMTAMIRNFKQSALELFGVKIESLHIQMKKLESLRIPSKD